MVKESVDCIDVENLTECPSCKGNWDGGDIYEVLRLHTTYDKYSDEEVKKLAEDYGWSEKNKKHFSQLIGIEISELYDGVSFWECPHCNKQWKRIKNNLTKGYHV